MKPAVCTHSVRLVEFNPGTGKRWVCAECGEGWNSNVQRDVIERQPCDAHLMIDEIHRVVDAAIARRTPDSPDRGPR